MFLNFLKKFLLKRKLKKALSLDSDGYSVDKIRTVGLLIDETYFAKKEDLIRALEDNGV